MSHLNPNDILADQIIAALQGANLLSTENHDSFKQKLSIGKVTAADWQNILIVRNSTLQPQNDETTETGN